MVVRVSVPFSLSLNTKHTDFSTGLLHYLTFFLLLLTIFIFDAHHSDIEKLMTAFRSSPSVILKSPLYLRSRQFFAAT